MGLFMELQTKVNIVKSLFKISPTDRLLFVGSCFAENIGRRFVENQFDAIVNPYGTMYNPASVLHTIEKGPLPPPSPVGREPLTPSKDCDKVTLVANDGNYSPCGGEGGSSLPMGEGGGRGPFSIVCNTLAGLYIVPYGLTIASN